MRVGLFVRLGLVTCAAASAAAVQTRSSALTVHYATTHIDADDQLTIVTVDRREIIPSKLANQVGFEDAAVSEDGTLVGWLALFPNGGTSYPIPLHLLVLGHGRTRDFTGSSLPIWQWCFADRDRQVVFEQETTHSGIGRHFEEWNIDSNTRTRTYVPPDPEAPPGPDWTTFTNQSGGECHYPAREGARP